MTHLDLVALIVDDYDPAIDFFVRVLRSCSSCRRGIWKIWVSSMYLRMWR